MKTKYKILAICATIALLAVPFACIGCSADDAVGPPVVYGEWVTETAPTCENDGVEIRTALSDPNIVETRAIPAVGHDWNAWETVTEPTCLIAGVETRSCKTCENSDMRAIPAVGHAFGEWETVLAADCEHDGSAFRVCQRDETHTEYTTITALGHDFGDWIVTLAPTCTTSGIETRYCRNNNKHTEIRSVEPYGHNWGPAVTTIAATCTEPGEKVSVCANDSTHTQVAAIKAIGHDYGDWVTSVPATESDDGVEIRVCRHDSSHVETRTIDALGSEGLLYLLNANGTEYSVRYDYPRPTGTVYIPATHNGLPVTAIANNAFINCKEIERVVFLGNNIKTIGRYAFALCTSLKSLELPEGLTSISYYAFVRCDELKSIHFPSTVREIGCNDSTGQYTGPFMGSVLETITVAERNEFYNVDGGCLIEKSTDTVIGGTKTAVIPDYITTIARRAFFGSNIESVRIPASVSSIGMWAFRACNELREVIFENGALTSLDDASTNSCSIFGYCENLERVVFPDNITKIGSGVFTGCTALREIVFGKNLQTIGWAAFRGCDAVEICEIPASVTSINGSAFSSAGVVALTIAEGNTTFIKDENCIIDRTTDTLVSGTDDGIIPSYVKHIGNYAFYYRSIKSIVIPSGVQSIGYSAFYGCSSLTSIEYEAGCKLESIGNYAFVNVRTTSIEIPAGVESVGLYAFQYWTSTQTIVVKGFPTQERADAVWGEDWRKSCAAEIVYEGDGLLYTLNSDGTEYSVRCDPDFKPIGTVVIPATYKGLPVTEIGANAFEYCKIDNVVFLGNNLRKIGSNAFYSCAELQSLELPKGLTTVSSGAFAHCYALETITVAEGNELYKSDGGCLIEIATNAVVTGTKNAVIPDYVTTIRPSAFSSSNIELVNIPSSVISIGSGAFSNCRNLREVTFENGNLTSLDDGAILIFAHCRNLERVVLSDNITAIGKSVFWDCTALREIILGKNLKTIDASAFSNCFSVQTIIIPADVESIGYHAFQSWTAEQTIVIKGFASQEEADEAWGGDKWRRDCNAVIIYEGGDADGNE